MQDNNPIAYISKSLGPEQQALSVYERKLLAVVYAVQKWGADLSHKPFIIKTDQKKLDHKLNTPFQYKTGASNVAADALSRQTGAELLPMLLGNAQEGHF